MLEDGLQEEMDNIESEQDWRNNHYWNEQSEVCLVYYKPIVDYIFRTFAGAKSSQVSRKKHMSFNDWRLFVTTMGIMNDKLADRDINQAFNFSMMTQIDEVNKERHLQMTEVEFFEALARLAEVMSPAPYGFNNDEGQWPYEKTMYLALWIKLESLFGIVYQ